VSDLRHLPFDQYQRYRLVADLLGRLPDRPDRLRVLDVGGGTGVLRRFRPEDDVTLVDVVPAGITERMVVGDGSRLPFADGSFDAVCAFDTLEHVPPDRRDAFVAEASRVARRWVVLAGPYFTPAVRRAEELLQRFLLAKLDFRHGYLEEHIEYGLPERERVEAVLRERGAAVGRVGHGNLDRWLALMLVSMFLDHDPALRELAGELYAFYNERLYATDWSEPVYRHVVLGAFDGAELPSPDDLGPGPAAGGAATSAGDGAAVAVLAAELFAFDRERDRWRRHDEDQRAVLADRERRLAEHAEVLGDRERQLAEHRRVQAELEALVERQRRTLKSPLVALFARLHGLVSRRG